MLYPTCLGKRICLGESLAKMQLFMFAGALIQKFKFVTPEGELTPGFDAISGTTTQPINYKVVALLRN